MRQTSHQAATRSTAAQTDSIESVPLSKRLSEHTTMITASRLRRLRGLHERSLRLLPLPVELQLRVPDLLRLSSFRLPAHYFTYQRQVQVRLCWPPTKKAPFFISFNLSLLYFDNLRVGSVSRDHSSKSSGKWAAGGKQMTLNSQIENRGP